MGDVVRLPTGWQESVLAQIDEAGGEPIKLGPAQNIAAYRSRSDPMKVYYVVDLGWIAACTCDGFRYRSDCFHARDYLDRKEGNDGT